MSFPTKKDRERCWGAKDEYWRCLDKNNEDENLCLKFRETFKSSCAATWVAHFDRKRRYEKFKEEANLNWVEEKS